ncbi:hypothetical protein JNUCC0626_46950 [Lentzea sp. JNUCC 0626]|uniref:hypothetical protein n=1 Tax=Lentzea sp. JNUCC 0626 TaxID=3367513 RepID=UPI0037491F60
MRANDIVRPVGRNINHALGGIFVRAMSAVPIRPAEPSVVSGCASDVAVVVTWSNPDSDQQDPHHRDQARLCPGEQFSFGISSRSGAFEPLAERTIGTFEAMAENLFISNFTSSTTFAIENLEGGAELVKVPPRRKRLVIPFEMSRVLIPSWKGLIQVVVFGRPPELVEGSGSDAVESSPFRLDENSKYFLVLVALCEPRLRGSSMAALPSVQEIVDRLKQSDRFRDANRSSVNYHIDYLCERKLQVEQWAMYSANGRMHSKREALASFALRYELVTEEHLALLASPVRSHVLTGIDVPAPRCETAEPMTSPGPSTTF